MKKLSQVFKLLFSVILLTQSAPLMADDAPGDDLAPVFARAANGAPLRYVALGGSITNGGKGWLDGWLKEQFPKSAVTTVNAGVPATGSELGVFRLDRDVIAYQPDLVAIEFCVNDWGLTDDEVNRYMETIIVKLKQLPHPPAIIILEAAASPKKVKLERHRKIAQHYGFLEVDLQEAVDAELQSTGQTWKDLFADEVHPNEKGHAFYAKVIGDKLAPFVEKAKAGSVTAVNKPLPPLLSTKPLLMDAHLVDLVETIGGWQIEGVPGWPGIFFHGVLSAKPGDSLKMSLRGSTFGIFYMQQQGFGTFTAAIDDKPSVTLDANVQHPYKHVLLAQDLPPGEHTLLITTPSDPAVFKPVKLGYVLIAGDSAPEKPASAGTQ